ncbi:TRPC2 protein, partial [Lophotis ruficrista]|nr:TRPC2 protein [Lophotis ruficrista]
ALPVRRRLRLCRGAQDPRYPAENLLREDGARPWLGCARERSGQLRAELQLERASAIGYVDVGNCGCAFLQVEVGRSSWPLDRPYLTLLPSVALMTPADSKLGRNRCGVRMFKEADFLALAAGQKWDRLRLTCSQPFSKHSQFGLSFIRVRMPPEPEHTCPAPVLSPGAGADGPSVCRSSREEEQLKSRLQQLEPGARSPARLSRPARMAMVSRVLRVFSSRVRRRFGSQPGARALLGAGGLLLVPRSPGSAQDPPAAPPRARRQPDGRQSAGSAAGRSLPAAPRRARAGRRAGARGHRERQAGRGDSAHGDAGVCPICSGRFSLELLPAPASRCGEEEAAWPSSSLAGASRGAWVPCPVCGLPFGAAEVEWHASACGE